MSKLFETKGLKVVIFDLCGVLINVKWENMEDILKRDGVDTPVDDFRKISESVFQLKNFKTIEEGVNVFLDKLKLQNNHKLRTDQIKFLNTWGKLASANARGQLFLKYSKQNDLKTAVLTNVFPIKAEWKENWDISNIDKFFFSYQTGVLKPNPKAFLNVVDYFGVKPEECLMIGNSNKKDIIPAQELGMKTLYFKNETKN